MVLDSSRIERKVSTASSASPRSQWERPSRKRHLSASSWSPRRRQFSDQTGPSSRTSSKRRSSVASASRWYARRAKWTLGVGDAHEIRLGPVEPAAGVLAPEEDAVGAAGEERQLAEVVLTLVELADLAHRRFEEAIEEVGVFRHGCRRRLDAPRQDLAEGEQHFGVLEAQLFGARRPARTGDRRGRAPLPRGPPGAKGSRARRGTGGPRPSPLVLRRLRTLGLFEAVLDLDRDHFGPERKRAFQALVGREQVLEARKANRRAPRGRP